MFLQAPGGRSKKRATVNFKELFVRRAIHVIRCVTCRLARREHDE